MFLTAVPSVTAVSASATADIHKPVFKPHPLFVLRTNADAVEAAAIKSADKNETFITSSIVFIFY